MVFFDSMKIAGYIKSYYSSFLQVPYFQLSVISIWCRTSGSPTDEMLVKLTAVNT